MTKRLDFFCLPILFLLLIFRFVSFCSLRQCDTSKMPKNQTLAVHSGDTEGDGQKKIRRDTLREQKVMDGRERDTLRCKSKKKRKEKHVMEWSNPSPPGREAVDLSGTQKLSQRKRKKKQSEKIRKSGSRCNSKLQRLPILSSMVRWMLRI